MKIEFSEHDPNIGAAALSGSLTVSSVDDFRSTVEAWIDERANLAVLLLDLAEVDLLDSSGLGGILSLFKKMQEREGSLKLVSLSKKARMVFEITRAHDTFEIFDDLEQALADCRCR